MRNHKICTSEILNPLGSVIPTSINCGILNPRDNSQKDKRIWRIQLHHILDVIWEGLKPLATR
jgi:hypothetical protein